MQRLGFPFYRTVKIRDVVDVGAGLEQVIECAGTPATNRLVPWISHVVDEANQVAAVTQQQIVDHTTLQAPVDVHLEGSVRLRTQRFLVERNKIDNSLNRLNINDVRRTVQAHQAGVAAPHKGLALNLVQRELLHLVGRRKLR